MIMFLENPLLFRFLNQKRLRNYLSLKAEADSELPGSVHLIYT